MVFSFGICFSMFSKKLYSDSNFFGEAFKEIAAKIDINKNKNLNTFIN
tara:strand:- start:2079 stop:2222 length:144 start_codon:yes stop_codon:yes gene_type:complete